jgi:hypothetical protein
MARRVFVIAALVSVMSAGALFAPTYVQSEHWYSDSAFTNLVGEQIQDCDGFTASWGATWAPYLMHDVENCNTGGGSQRCLYWANDQWNQMQCPN